MGVIPERKFWMLLKKIRSARDHGSKISGSLLLRLGCHPLTNNLQCPLELLQMVITVSLETNKIVAALPQLNID